MEPKVSTETPSAMIASLCCMQDRTSKIASEGDIEDQADISHLRAR
jgi:hypothetical protein